MKETVTLSSREIQRLQVLEQVSRGTLLLVAGTPLMRISYRQAKRLWARYLRLIVKEIAHGGTVRKAGNYLSLSITHFLTIL
jgi:hypothetical protein